MGGFSKRCLMIISLVLLAGGGLTSNAGSAYGGIEYSDDSTQDTISLSVNRSSTSTTPRQRITNPTSPTGGDQGARRPSRSVPGSVNRTGEETSSTEARCLNRSERMAAVMENRECDTTIAPDVGVNPRPQEPAPAANNEPEIVEEPVEIVITASDLLELIPSTPQILMDRGPFGLKNAHTNFYASDHSPQTVTQTMFGQQVTITATPIEYRWDYGDGNSLITELPGYPVEVFNTETDTSHQYTDTGLYSVGLTTVFEGTYQVDGGETQQVSSTVTQQADPVEIRILRAVTRNVDQTCQQNPQAWGC